MECYRECPCGCEMEQTPLGGWECPNCGHYESK
jgi:hypothetical protein